MRENGLIIKSQIPGFADLSTEKFEPKAREAAEWLIANGYEDDAAVRSAFRARQTSDMSDDPDAEKNDEDGIIRVAKDKQVQKFGKDYYTVLEINGEQYLDILIQGKGFYRFGIPLKDNKAEDIIKEFTFRSRYFSVDYKYLLPELFNELKLKHGFGQEYEALLKQSESKQSQQAGQVKQVEQVKEAEHQQNENTKEKDFTTQYEEYKQRFHDDSRVDYTPIAIDEVNRVILHEQKDRRGGWEQTSYVVTQLSQGAGDPNANYSAADTYEALNAFETYNRLSNEPYTDMQSPFGQLVHLQRTELDFYSEFIPVKPISLNDIKSEISLRQLRLKNNNVTAAVRNIAFEYNLPILSYPDAKQDFERFLNEAINKVNPDKAQQFLTRQLERAKNCLEKNKIDAKTQTLPAAWYNATIETIQRFKKQEEEQPEKIYEQYFKLSQSIGTKDKKAIEAYEDYYYQHKDTIRSYENSITQIKTAADIVLERAEKRVQLTEDVAERSAKLEKVFSEAGLDTEAEIMAKIPKNQEKVTEEWNQDYFKAKNEKRLADIEKNVPEEMKALPHWCAFKTYKDKNSGDMKKVIINCKDGLWASSIDHDTWTTFDVALDFARANNCMGLTFALKDSGISCVDLDKCIDDKGMRSQTTWDVLNCSSGSYAEKSVSNRGIHVFVKGGIGSEYKNRNDEAGIEAYDNHFMSVTGNLVSKTNALKECPDKLKSYLQDKLGKKTIEREWTPGVSSASDSAVIERIRNSKKRGETFNRLYRGDISGYTTHSDADMDMFNILAFFTDCDPHQMKSIFCSSGLYRDKKEAYLDHTINKAIKTLYKRPDKIGAGSSNAGCNGR